MPVQATVTYKFRIDRILVLRRKPSPTENLSLSLLTIFQSVKFQVLPLCVDVNQLKFTLNAYKFSFRFKQFVIFFREWTQVCVCRRGN